RNAFNLIDRGSFTRAACEKFPGLSQWTHWCYSTPSILLYDHKLVINSTCGVQQGDPLGPLYFCCGIASLVEKIQRFSPRYNKWYMDDGGIISSADNLVAIWNMLIEKAPELGLELNLPNVNGRGWIPAAPNHAPFAFRAMRRDKLSSSQPRTF